VFNGRESDQDRYDFDFRPLDSYGARFSLAASPHLVLSASYGWLKSPEELEPDVSQDRLGASLLFHGGRGSREFSAGIVYGGNRHSDHPGFEHSLVMESTLRWGERSSMFGRLTWVQKSASDLAVANLPEDSRFDIYHLSLGTSYRLFRLGPGALALGLRGSVSVIPRSLEPSYGSRTPAGITLFLRAMPGTPGSDHR